jgi:Zn-dependent protease with chaperone function
VGAVGVMYQNRGLAALTILVTFVLVYIGLRRVEDSGTPLRVRKGVPLLLPPLLTTYLIITAFFFLVPVSVLLLYLSRIQGYRSTLSVAIGFLMALFVWYVVRTVLTGSPAVEAFESFIEKQPERDQPEIKKLNILVGILPSIVLVHGYIAVIYILDFSFTIQEPNDALAVLIGFTPGIYLLTGVLLQTTSFIGKMRSLFRGSTTIETDRIRSEYHVRQLDSVEYDAYSVSTFSNHYIFISGKFFEDFEDSEIQSIIYHEESHIKNGDAFLSFIIPIICLLTVSPQGVLFESLDFRSREIRADREASSRSSTNLKQALNKLRYQELTNSNQGEETESTFSPFSGKVSESKPDQYRLFFGAHAIKEAHPNLPDRIDRL